MTKICQDCVYARKYGELLNCAHPRFGINLVTGKKVEMDCRIQRYDDIPSHCGREGKYFEEISDTVKKVRLLAEVWG